MSYGKTIHGGYGRDGYCSFHYAAVLSFSGFHEKWSLPGPRALGLKAYKARPRGDLLLPLVSLHLESIPRIPTSTSFTLYA